MSRGRHPGESRDPVSFHLLLKSLDDQTSVC